MAGSDREGNRPPRENTKKPGGTKRRDRWFFWVMTSAALAVPIAILVIPSYNKNNPAEIECTVTSAEGGLESASARGAVSWWSVTIHTSDCGTLSMSSGITEANRDSVAASLEPGEKYVFSIGSLTKAALGAYRMLGVQPEVYAFESAA